MPGARKLVANIRLTPSVEKAGVPRRFSKRVNEPCNWLSARAFNTGTSRQYELHKPCYRGLRGRFELTAQVASCCIATVTYKAGAEGPRKIRKHAAQPYDDRIVSFRTNHIVSIWTPKGRLLTHRKGEVDLARAATLPVLFVDP
jgi:putative transposase